MNIIDTCIDTEHEAVLFDMTHQSVRRIVETHHGMLGLSKFRLIFSKKRITTETGQRRDALYY